MLSKQHPIEELYRLAAIYNSCKNTKPAGEILDDYLREEEHAPSKTYDKALNLVRKCLDMGHESPLEHLSMTFDIQGVSRVCTHQLVRHRLASYTQQSQRSTAFLTADSMIVPESVKKWIRQGGRDCAQMVQDSFNLYSTLVAAGVPKEDARFLCPEGVITNIVMTMNLRELLHFFRERLCGAAQWEIRHVCMLLHEHVLNIYPWLSPYAGPKCQDTDHCLCGRKEKCAIGKYWKEPESFIHDLNAEACDDTPSY